MQQWRQANPDYWQRKIQVGRYVVRGKLAKALRDFASRDEIDVLFPLVVGIVSHLTKHASRDEIASEIQRLTLHGHGVLQPTTTAQKPRHR